MDDFLNSKFIKVKAIDENGHISFSKNIQMHKFYDLSDPVSMFIEKKYRFTYPLSFVKKNDICEIWGVIGGTFPNFEMKLITASKIILINENNEERNFTDFLIE